MKQAGNQEILRADIGYHHAFGQTLHCFDKQNSQGISYFNIAVYALCAVLIGGKCTGSLNYSSLYGWFKVVWGFVQ